LLIFFLACGLFFYVLIASSFRLPAFTRGFPIWTIHTSALAAIPSFQMIFFCEHNIAFRGEVIIFFFKFIKPGQEQEIGYLLKLCQKICFVGAKVLLSQRGSKGLTLIRARAETTRFTALEGQLF
jgi:hypothetical protein